MATQIRTTDDPISTSPRGLDDSTSVGGGKVGGGKVGGDGVGDEGTVGGDGVGDEGTVGGDGVGDEGTVGGDGVGDEGTVDVGGAGGDKVNSIIKTSNPRLPPDTLMRMCFVTVTPMQYTRKD